MTAAPHASPDLPEPITRRIDVIPLALPGRPCEPMPVAVATSFSASPSDWHPADRWVRRRTTATVGAIRFELTEYPDDMEGSVHIVFADLNDGPCGDALFYCEPNETLDRLANLHAALGALLTAHAGQPAYDAAAMDPFRNARLAAVAEMEAEPDASPDGAMLPPLHRGASTPYHAVVSSVRERWEGGAGGVHEPCYVDVIEAEASAPQLPTVNVRYERSVEEAAELGGSLVLQLTEGRAPFLIDGVTDAELDGLVAALVPLRNYWRGFQVGLKQARDANGSASA